MEWLLCIAVQMPFLFGLFAAAFSGLDEELPDFSAPFTLKWKLFKHDPGQNSLLIDKQFIT